MAQQAVSQLGVAKNSVNRNFDNSAIWAVLGNAVTVGIAFSSFPTPSLRGSDDSRSFKTQPTAAIDLTYDSPTVW
jgi:hypothetical protein